MLLASRLPVVCLLMFFLVGPVAAAPRGQLEAETYAAQLRGMWLAQSIANWTGLLTEGDRIDKPFYTDADWEDFGFVFQEPWRADDDTDVEYILLHLMTEYGTTLLTPQQFADGWDTYFRREDYVWISNLSSLRLIRRGALPPATGMGAVNAANDPQQEMSYLMIDAQLTTELCGALAPGMPAYALRICDLPIRNTAASYAAHAAQHFVLLYALAPVVDPALSDRQKVIWLATEARRYIPDSSKTADIFDFVLGEFLRMCPEADAPGCDDWEATRDRIADRYQHDSTGNGFKYYDWYDSAVNFATGVMALLYGQGDLQRTIQIGTLAGWDSDNGTATMGGLLGLMNGYDWVVAQFPDQKVSDRYSIRRTRSFELPDYLPRDPAAEDSFALMAARMRPLVEDALAHGGGRASGGSYLLPELPAANHVGVTPTRKLYESSANNRVRLGGGKVAAFSSSPAPVDALPGPSNFADGAEQDFSGREPPAPSDEYWGLGGNVDFTVSYSHAVPLKTLRFIEGGAHSNGVGYFRTVTPQIMIDGAWQDLPAGAEASARITDAPYQIIDWTLPETRLVAAIRLRGATVGGFASIIELDALADESTAGNAAPMPMPAVQPRTVDMFDPSARLQ